MVFGFGEGKIELMLDKTAFSYGETVEGKLKLTLKKSKAARQLRVTIKAERTTTTYSRGRRSIRKDTMFSSDVVLDGEKEYSSPGGEYDFSIQVPGKDVIPARPEGKLGTAITAVQFLGGMASQIKWYLEASLDIPKTVDIKKSIQISVS